MSSRETPIAADKAFLEPMSALSQVEASRLLLQTAIAASGKDPLDPVSERPFQSPETRQLLSRRARPQINVYNLSDAALSASNVEQNMHPAAQAFRRARYNTKRIWNNVKRNGGSAPTISNQELLDFAMKPSSKVVEVTAQYDSAPDRRTNSHDVLAYALVNTDENRLTGIFNPHNLFFPEKYLTRLVMDRVIEEFGDRPIHTRVITSPERFANKASMDLMLEYGFRLDGSVEVIPDARVPAMPGVRDSEEIFELTSHWLIREPGQSTPEQLRHLHDLDESMRRTAQALAPGTVFTAADATLAFWNTGKARNISYYFAEQQPENFVYSVSLFPPDKVPYRQNLEHISGDISGSRFGPGTLNGIFIFDDVLEEVQKNGGDIAEFLKAQVTQLKKGGQLVVKGKITPGQDQQFFIRMARKDLDCRISRYVPVKYYGEEYFELYLEPADSVAIREISDRRIENPSFLTREFYQNRDSREIRELVSRKHSDEVLDLVVFSRDGRMLERIDAPRGIPNAMFHKNDATGNPRDYELDGVLSSGHERESIALIRKQGESYRECVDRGLAERTGITHKDSKIIVGPPGDLLFTDPARYSEIRRFIRVEVDSSSEVKKIESNYTGFSNSGKVQSRRIDDMLKSNSLTSPSLLVAAYELLADLPHLKAPMWPTAQKILRDQQKYDHAQLLQAAELFHTLRPYAGERWLKLNSTPSADFQFNQVLEGTFAEYGRTGNLLPSNEAPRTVDLQYATIAEHLGLTNNRIPVCLCYRSGESYRFGFQIADDKPLVEQALKQNEIADGYDFYVPNYVPPQDYPHLKQFLINAVEKETGLKVLSVRRLGRSLLDSSGLTPTRSYPTLLEVDASSIQNSNVFFCDARDTLNNAHYIRSLITRATTYRALHALGLLEK